MSLIKALFVCLILVVPCFCQIRSSVTHLTRPCPTRPLGCSLNCPYGFTWGLDNSCLCICHLDPCLNKVCGRGELCTVINGAAQCLSQLAPRESVPIRQSAAFTVGECPKLVGGLCIERCRLDSDCSGYMKCCANGCGRECVLPVAVSPILSSLPIQPISAKNNAESIARNSFQHESVHSVAFNAAIDKIGSCPASAVFKDKNCEVECNHDSECAGVMKCCDSGCGRVCAAPERATSVFTTFFESITSLISFTLTLQHASICARPSNDFLLGPSAMVSYRLACPMAILRPSNVYCWCVNTRDGIEIQGTKVSIDQRPSLDCKYTEGCPLASCDCKNICDEVTCANKFDECQLVEPDCAQPPCAPVPRSAQSMQQWTSHDLAQWRDGIVYAVDSMLDQFLVSSGMFQTYETPELAVPLYSLYGGASSAIGYNGLGFCCPSPESAVRAGSCEAHVPRHLTDCAAECRSDVDCPSTDKCCFDGCGLKCVSIAYAPNPFQSQLASHERPRVDAIAANKEIISPLIAECPSLPKNGGTQACNTECSVDADCRGLRRCCVAGCSRICVYPEKTTPCIHDAISRELYVLQNTPRCTPAGNYETVQCDDARCFCVDPITGIEIPNTWVPAKTTPICQSIQTSTCPILSCATTCPHGFKLDKTGCPTCECLNPCADVRCVQGQICIAAEVQCFQKSNCPAQPRCVSNICKGHPYINPNGFIEQCSHSCPQGYWCNNVGFPGHGGVCCPEVITTTNGQQVIQSKHQNHPGKCEKKHISVEFLSSAPTCKSRCKEDSECRPHSKCCFDGCGTMCIQIVGEIQPSIVGPVETVSRASSEVNVRVQSKLGECPRLPDGPRYDCRSGIDTCQSDFECTGIKKCCSDGCFKRCMYAERTTACLHLQAAFEKVKKNGFVQCNTVGEFTPIQCDSTYCWCVTQNGREISGTRVLDNQRPNCQARRACEERNCSGHPSCPFGHLKDSTGCPTCECENPCDKAQCPDSNQICVPHPVDCIDSVCPQVPKCVLNVCIEGYPLFHESTWEPVACRDDSQCRGTNTHCRVFRKNGGYCCVGLAPEVHAGTCPKGIEASLGFPMDESACQVHCKQDDDCHSLERCCLTGACSLTCVPAVPEPAQSPASKVSGSRIGECPVVEDLGLATCGASRVDNCRDDEDCPSVQKCCYDGCAKTCQNSEISTECFHAVVAAESLKSAKSSSIFTPTCNSDGEFDQVQRFRGLSWCVDAHGIEIPGTRVPRKHPDCGHPRNCPIMSCTRRCLFGPEMDNNGCPTCECKNPCRTVACPINHVCRIVPIKCFLSTCSPVAKCILNVCPRGEPLERIDNQQLAECSDQNGPQCPHGWFCHKIGISSIGYCCPGMIPATQASATSQCLPIPILVTPRNVNDARLECKLNHDCAQNGPCCFNGAGTSCKYGPKKPPAVDTSIDATNSTPIQAVTSVTLLNIEKMGVCPNNPQISNPGCRSDCTRDSDCKDFVKCCPYGCGRLCQYPKVVTACIHKLAAITEELSKFVDNSTLQKPAVQCTNDGLFRRIQCDPASRQCWCVDVHSGIEIFGTRMTSLANQEPNCLTPRFCATSCNDLKCEYGFKTDKNGCPLNGFCQCKSPCDDLECAKDTDVCVVKEVTCFGQPCPNVAICRPNPCSSDQSPLKDDKGSVLRCTKDEQCRNSKCSPLIGESSLGGLCCPSDPVGHITSSSAAKVGVCPVSHAVGDSGKCTTECMTDKECAGFDLCCKMGCSKICTTPVNSTNCIHYQSGISALQRQNAISLLAKPQCEPTSGMFAATQCSTDGSCWCVDTVTGSEFLGTKTTTPTSDACTSNISCTINCDDQRTRCPFGLETNSQGCPKSSNCQCKNPCNYIQCPANHVCLLRPVANCADTSCVPVPTCERNPCVNTQKPAVEPRTYSQFTCLEDKSQICPTGFYCTGYDSNQVGICCPGQEPILSQQVSVEVCPHGDPFSDNADGAPVSCSTNRNSCPSTHYCLSKPSHSKGICCVTKRYVCNLEQDSGPCNAAVPRFYYDIDTQKCQSFKYGGCSGNLNNFATSEECDKFCIGTGVDILNTMMSDEGGAPLDIYNMGFSLTGPLLREKHTPEINDVFRKMLVEKFDIDDNEIRDLFIRDDNTVRFSIHAPNAKEKAEVISKAVSNGQFKFDYHNAMYKAEPQTWFLHQVEEEKQSGNWLFTALLIACILFAAIILLALCCGCSFLRNRRVKDTTSTNRAASPSIYGQISACAHNATHHHSPGRSSISQFSMTALNQRRPTKKGVFSTDDVSAMRQNAASGGSLLTPVSSMTSTDAHGGGVGPHTQGGRRPSRATLYY
uniref:WAP domain-containing protein n=1 Tax=Panagrellus redivivus TaxID=6233 RepID=A0A7E4UXH3_PANRE